MTETALFHDTADSIRLALDEAAQLVKIAEDLGLTTLVGRRIRNPLPFQAFVSRAQLERVVVTCELKGSCQTLLGGVLTFIENSDDSYIAGTFAYIQELSRPLGGGKTEPQVLAAMQARALEDGMHLRRSLILEGCGLTETFLRNHFGVEQLERKRNPLYGESRVEYVVIDDRDRFHEIARRMFHMLNDSPVAP